jgi:hypothetical protein
VCVPCLSVLHLWFFQANVGLCERNAGDYETIFLAKYVVIFISFLSLPTAFMSWLRRRRRRFSRSVNKIKLIESRRCTSEEKNYLRFLSNIWYPSFKCRQFVREIYDGQLFVKLKGGSHFPGLDPWVLHRVYI